MTEFLQITGGVPLHGTVEISGAKNAALPLLIASLLTQEKVLLSRVPNLEDIHLTLHLLEHLGSVISSNDGAISVQTPKLIATDTSYSLVKALRASFWVLGPLLARGRAAKVALPGGDIIGARPVDIHLSALTQMGADLKVKHGVVYGTAPKGLKPAKIEFRFPSVGATHQVMMAAALTPGETSIHGAAREPEIVALSSLLNKMGAEVEGAGTDNIIIKGKDELGGAELNLIGDRIEAGTYLLAGATTGGKVTVEGIEDIHFGDFLDLLHEMGLEVSKTAHSVTLARNTHIKPVHFSTGPFPKIATDFQALLMTTLCLAQGESSIEETVFEGRFNHISELCRMGAQIRVDDRIAYVRGIEKLTAAPVEGFDIRGAAALVIAALAAEGTSVIYEPNHLRRGYENLVEKLQGLGANIRHKQEDIEDYLFTGC